MLSALRELLKLNSWRNKLAVKKKLVLESEAIRKGNEFHLIVGYLVGLLGFSEL